MADVLLMKLIIRSIKYHNKVRICDSCFKTPVTEVAGDILLSREKKAWHLKSAIHLNFKPFSQNNNINFRMSCAAILQF